MHAWNQFSSTKGRHPKKKLADLRTLSQLSLTLPPLAQLGQILIGTFFKTIPPPPPSLQLGQYAFEILVDPPPTHHQINVLLLNIFIMVM